MTTPDQPHWLPPARALADEMVELAGDSVRAVLLYGSHLLRTNPDRHSAYDFVVVIDDYRSFYSALKRGGALRRPVFVMSWLAQVLPPNSIAFVPREGEAIAKCLIVSRWHFELGLGPRPKDHFLLGRLVQKVGLVWAATEEEELWVGARLDRARADVLTWMAPYLDEPLDAAGLGQRLLEVCYQGEFRPEASNRAESIFKAQADHFEHVFEPVLERAAADGVMREEAGRYELVTPATAEEGRRWRRHFRLSKIRSTTRWLKHTVTFDNWLPYIVRKAERHSGTKIELTMLERRLPLIFLWPRAIKFLRNRPPKEIPR